MKRILTTLLLAVLYLNGHAAAVPDTTGLEARLKSHVYYLASEDLKGRKAGSEDAAKAAEYICAEWADMGLAPLGEDYRHEFTTQGSRYVNLIGCIEGNDPGFKEEIVVIGAHYDHLGVREGKVYPGADDNASGTATIIEVARMLLENKDRLARTIYIAAFDGEEQGLYGSNHLASELKDRNVMLMLSVDMVGWYAKSGSLTLEGYGTIRNGRQLLETLAKKDDIELSLKKFENSVLTATDTRGFAILGDATLAVSTGLESPYHKPEDTADKIDYQGMSRISCYLADLVSDVASDAVFRLTGRVASIHGKRLFSFGVAGGLGPSALDFGKNSAVKGQSRTSYRVGIQANMRLGSNFSFRTGAGLESVRYYMPSDDIRYLIPSAETIFDNAVGVGVRRIDVPLELLWNIVNLDGRDAMYLSGGVFYNYVLGCREGKQGISVDDSGLEREGRGWQLGFGFAIGPIILEYTSRHPLTPLYHNGGGYFPENTSLPVNYFTLGWRF